MDQITDDIWIGSSTDAKDRDSLHREGIRSILCLDGCLLGMKPDELGVNQIEVVELVDGPGNRPEVFLRAVGLLKKLKMKHSPVLVHCHWPESISSRGLQILHEGRRCQSRAGNEANHVEAKSRHCCRTPRSARFLIWTFVESGRCENYPPCRVQKFICSQHESQKSL